MDSLSISSHVGANHWGGDPTKQTNKQKHTNISTYTVMKKSCKGYISGDSSLAVNALPLDL